MKLNCNFLGGGGAGQKKIHGESMEFFLELHNLILDEGLAYLLISGLALSGGAHSREGSVCLSVCLSARGIHFEKAGNVN